MPTDTEILTARIHELESQKGAAVRALKVIQSIAKDPGHRTMRTQIQTCRFFDELILPTVDKALDLLDIGKEE